MTAALDPLRRRPTDDRRLSLELTVEEWAEVGQALQMSAAVMSRLPGLFSGPALGEVSARRLHGLYWATATTIGELIEADDTRIENERAERQKQEGAKARRARAHRVVGAVG